MTANRPAGVPEHAIAESEGVTSYSELKQMIIARIRSGEWPPNHRIPSENDLISELRVSKMTVNRALRELATEGELVRIRGVGSFVAEPKGHSGIYEVRNIADEISERGHSHSSSVIFLAEESIAPEIAHSMEIEVGSKVFHSLIIHKENNVPVQLEDRYVNPAEVPAYMEQDFSSITPNFYLSSIAPLVDAEHIIEAVVPQPWECKLLVVFKTEPCLAIKRRTWSSTGVVSVVRLIYPGSRYRLESRSKGIFL